MILPKLAIVHKEKFFLATNLLLFLIPWKKIDNL